MRTAPDKLRLSLEASPVVNRPKSLPQRTRVPPYSPEMCLPAASHSGYANTSPGQVPPVLPSVLPDRAELRAIKTWIHLNCPLWPDYEYRPDRPAE